MADENTNTPAEGAPAEGTPAEGTPAEGTIVTPPAEGTPPADGDPNSDGSGDAPAAEIKAPDVYADFTMPEGVEMDAKALEVAAPVLKELNLPQDQAQKVVDAYAQIKEAEAVAASEAYTQQIDDWITEVKADKDLGGDAFDATAASSARAIDAYGDQELKDLLNSTGLGNHPAVVRFANNVGKFIGEDTPGGGNPPGSPKDRSNILYPGKKED